MATGTGKNRARTGIRIVPRPKPENKVNADAVSAAIATTKAISELEGSFDGIAVRVPVVNGSIIDITFISKRTTDVDEVNNILKEAAKEKKWENIFSVTEDQIVYFI